MAKRLIKPRINRLFRTYSEALLNDFGKRAKVIVVTVKKTPCPNCIWDNANQSGTGQYNGTGPQPFEGVCPVCQNNGVLHEEEQRRIRANARWGSASKDQPNQILPQGELPEGQVRIKTFFKFMDLLRKCSHVLVDGIRCTKVGEPKPRGLQDYVTVTVVLQRDD